MQIQRLHRNIYKLARYAASQEKCEAVRKKYEAPVKKWLKLKEAGVPDETCQETLGISRATFYRHKRVLKNLDLRILPPTKRPKKLRKPLWGEDLKQLVLKIRRENPTYGKAKIAVILKRDHAKTASESTVGRIIKHLMQKGLVQTSASAPRMRRKRRFKGHARPWNYGMKGRRPGELIQIDHMSVTKNGIHFKHFKAWDGVSKLIHACIYSNATSLSAKKFLLDLLEKLPFKVVSVQVDGGSEFMRDFEEACKELNIALYVLPPRRPQWNGGVERGNRIFREEFYANQNVLADSIGAMRAELNKAVHRYNNYRPHSRLNGLTPMQYIQNYLLEVAA